MAAVLITVVANEVTLEGTAGFPVAVNVPSNEVTLEGTADFFNFRVNTPSNEVTLEGTAGFPVAVNVPSNEVTLEGTAGFPVAVSVSPNEVTLDGTATPFPYVYVVDSANHRVQAFDYNGNFKFTIGSHGTGNGQFVLPYAIAADGQHLYVTDAGNARVQKFTMMGVYVTQWGSVGTRAGQFNNPMGIAVDRNFVYVVDNGNNRFQIFDKNGTFIQSVGEFGSGTNQFNAPTEISVDALYLYINDKGNSRIVIFPKPTEFPNVAALPVIEIIANIYTQALSANLIIPSPTLESIIISSPDLSAHLLLPTIEINAVIEQMLLLNADLLLPAITLSSRIEQGSILSAIIELPVITLSSLFIADSNITAILRLPVINIDAYLHTTKGISTFKGIVMNPTNFGVTEYKNYPFNSFCYFNGKYFGANNTGIYLLEGITDNGAEIEAYIATGNHDSYLGSQSLPPTVKRQQELYLLHTSTGGMLVDYIDDIDGVFSYNVEGERVKLGRGLRGRMFKLKFKNVNGSKFTLDYARLKSEAISHRRR